MFSPTENKYRFKYLITWLTNPEGGIPCVYLPPLPSEDKILFKSEQKFIRTEPSEKLKQWMDEMVEERELNPEFVHSKQNKISEWEDQEFDRCQNGIWFWNDGVPTYLTGDHYKYLTQWQLYFGFPEYWEADLEIFYWQKYWEEDPDCYGGDLNTGRRTGKSAKMGFWATNRTSTNFKHFSGLQGEDNSKILDFYNQFILDPFYQLPYYSQPEYDLTTLQKKGIVFKETPKRNKKRKGKKLVLGSKLDYRTSEANKYDQAVLNSYVMEEAGKTLACSVWERWKFVKPCLHKGIYIRGKSYVGTTCEYLDVAGKGGRAYKKLVYASDFDVRNGLGRTISGLYAALMPHDCILEGFIDEHGRPKREGARKWILAERESVKNNPKDFSDLVRKYPLSWNEFFYVSADKCMFNAQVLQDRKNELTIMNDSHIRKVDLRWENNKRLTKVVIVDNPVNGWCKMSWLPKEDYERALLNNIDTRRQFDPDRGDYKNFYSPKNDSIFALGTDPIDHGIVVDSIDQSQDDVTSSRRSKPVVFAKRKYDASIDGPLNQEILEQRAREKYQYKTNKYFLMMDARPSDPNIYFERTLMICWLLGVSLNCEAQKPGVMNWFRSSGCEDFIWHKWNPNAANPYQLKKSDLTDGTPASTLTIQSYTNYIASDVDYFGHLYPFMEQVDDLLIASALKTREFDYYSAMGWTELAATMKPKKASMPMREISSLMPIYDRNGNIIN